MHKPNLYQLLSLLLAMLFLFGCTGNPVDPTQTTGVDKEASHETSKDVAPATAMAVEILPWNSDRCMVTSGCQMAETETGYYYVVNLLLYYADKTDLSKWTVVCADPICLHETTGMDICNATVETGFQVYDGRVYYAVNARNHPELYDRERGGHILISTAPDGTDLRLEFASEETTLSGGGSYQSIMLPERWISSTSVLNPDGTSTGKILGLDNSGLHELYQVTRDSTGSVSIDSISARVMCELFGDSVIWSCMLNDTAQVQFCRIDDEGISAIMEIGQYPTTGSYLSGNMLSFFRTGEGYFTADITTGEETKVAEARMENSCAYQLLPDCILESTFLGTESLALRDGAREHAMELYDGENWYSVALPESFANLPDTAFLFPDAVTSDRIFLQLRDKAEDSTAPAELYQILLTNPTPVLEYVGSIG